jgi:hypothetical protein
MGLVRTFNILANTPATAYETTVEIAAPMAEYLGIRYRFIAILMIPPNTVQ